MRPARFKKHLRIKILIAQPLNKVDPDHSTPQSSNHAKGKTNSVDFSSELYSKLTRAFYKAYHFAKQLSNALKPPS